MMRRRGGTNKLKQPKKDKTQGGRRKVVADISGDLRVGAISGQAILDEAEGASATASEYILGETTSVTDGQVPGPSTSSAIRQLGSSSDFVFKRPKTPPPKILKKGMTNSALRIPERNRIRSKLKPGKTGFPIGASLHGLPRSEKLERRSKGKSRLHSDVCHESGDAASGYHTSERISMPMFSIARKSSLPTEGQKGQESSEHVISYPRQTVTKLKFPPPRQRTVSEKRSKRSDNLIDQKGVKESFELCQGFSKIQIEDWYPMFDFHHKKRNEPEVEKTVSPDKPVDHNAENPGNDDDEWEESLVYVDLEDIPDVDSLFSSLSARRRRSFSVVDEDDDEEVEAEEEKEPPLSQVELKIYNLDSQLPVLLVGGKYLAGHWEKPCGTSLFFKKKGEDEEESNTSSDTSRADKSKLSNLLSEPEIPYDPIFGKNYAAQEDGYELVAKSIKILKARYFPVVNEELKGEDVIRDADDDFDQRDFQIPPVNMVREFMPSDVTYEKYVEEDAERRRKIREKWAKGNDNDETTTLGISTTPPVKTEPADHEDVYASDTEDLDNLLISEENEPFPGTSSSIND